MKSTPSVFYGFKHDYFIFLNTKDTRTLSCFWQLLFIENVLKIDGKHPSVFYGFEHGYFIFLNTKDTRTLSCFWQLLFITDLSVLVFLVYKIK
jgi:hypothetical protein